MAGHFTIIGGFGFVGSEITRQLKAAGHSVEQIGRNNWPEPGSELGNVIFTVGMTADFRKRLVETVEMQVMRPYDVLTKYKFDSFLGLSSARIYENAETTHEEAPLRVFPFKTDHVYNISKLAAESLCFAFDNPAIRVVRLSNVYGAADTSNLFMTAVLREALETGRVEIGQAETSSKDYIHVEDAARDIINIALHGKARLYNVACGQNFTHGEIAEQLRAHGINVQFKPDGQQAVFPPINTARVRSEFAFSPRSPAEILPGLIQILKNQRA